MLGLRLLERGLYIRPDNIEADLTRCANASTNLGWTATLLFFGPVASTRRVKRIVRQLWNGQALTRSYRQLRVELEDGWPAPTNCRWMQRRANRSFWAAKPFINWCLIRCCPSRLLIAASATPSSRPCTILTQRPCHLEPLFCIPRRDPTRSSLTASTRRIGDDSMNTRIEPRAQLALPGRHPRGDQPLHRAVRLQHVHAGRRLARGRAARGRASGPRANSPPSAR